MLAVILITILAIWLIGCGSPSKQEEQTGGAAADTAKTDEGEDGEDTGKDAEKTVRGFQGSDCVFLLQHELGILRDAGKGRKGGGGGSRV